MHIFRSMLELIYKIRSATNYGQFCYYFYELTVAMNRSSFKDEYTKYTIFHGNSSLPGEFNCCDSNLPNECAIANLIYRFSSVYPSTISCKPKYQKGIREKVAHHLIILENYLAYMLAVLTDPERIRIYYRYYDGQYIVINDVCYLYRKYKDHYYCARVALCGDEDVYSSALGPKERYPGNLRPLFNYLYPELSV